MSTPRMSDSSAIAFFPWVYVEESKTLGPLRLLPYRKEKFPGNLPDAKQVDIDGVLGAYSDRPNRPVMRATLLEYADWYTGMPLSEKNASALFRIRDLVAFSALSQRRLFRGHFDYCNSYTYSLVLQRFRPGDPGTFAFDTRRRDGATSHMWGTDEFAFHRPIHVDYNPKVVLDEKLLTSLLSLPTTHRAHEAIAEFNAANTDSSDVPGHVELVMSKSAFEWLLQIGTSADALVHALANRLKDIEPALFNGPLKSNWERRWQHQPRPLLAWAKDFCAARGVSAHGASRTPFVWGQHQHLAFISIFFPLLLKVVLAQEGFLEMEARDLEHLRRVEQYLMYDPFVREWDEEDTHPWADVAINARLASSAKLFYPD